MCIIETKTYNHPDGRREIIESTRRCREFRSAGTCSHKEYRTVEAASLVEHRPSSDRTDPNAVVITQGPGGRETVYQDVSRRQSVRRSSIRRSNTTEQRPPMETHSSGSSTSYPETRPIAPSPPPLRSSLRRPTISNERASRTVAPDGTAIYPQPPSRDLPRAADNERRTRIVEPERTRRGSISSTTAELGEDDPSPPPPARPRQRRPSVTIDTSSRPSSSSPTTSSPGLSSLPRPTVRSSRHDSARDLPSQYRPRTTPSTSRQRRQIEDDRQAQLLRDSLAETERRQQARENAANAAREASIERHRREAAAALEGDRARRREERSRDAERQANLEAELRQTDLERDASEARRRDYSDHAARSYDPLRTSGPPSSRRLTGSSFAPTTSSPLSARSPVYPPQSVSVHQPDPPGRRYSSLRDRGDAVVAREQVRAERATRRLSAALGEMTVEDPSYDQDVEYELDDYYVSETLQRRGSRRAQRDIERAERRREFWR